MDSPSQAAAPRPAGIVNCRIGSARWRLASRIAHAATASAAGQATLRGRSEAINESGASTASDHNIVPSQREGRQSRRKGTDAFDERRDFDIACSLMA